METLRTIEQRLQDDDRFQFRVRYSNIPPPTYRTHHLYHFLPRPGTEQAYQAALDFVAGKGRHHFLTFVGPVGTGKTMLALGIAWFWLDNTDSLVKYYQTEALLDELRRGFHADTEEKQYNFDRVMKLIKDAGLLVIDDLGVEQSTPFARAKLDMIIDHRYLGRLPTVVTTNLSPAQLGERIADRLSEGVVAVIDAPSWRKVKSRTVNRNLEQTDGAKEGQSDTD